MHSFLFRDLSIRKMPKFFLAFQCKEVWIGCSKLSAMNEHWPRRLLQRQFGFLIRHWTMAIPKILPIEIQRKKLLLSLKWRKIMQRKKFWKCLESSSYLYLVVTTPAFYGSKCLHYQIDWQKNPNDFQCQQLQKQKRISQISKSIFLGTKREKKTLP